MTNFFKTVAPAVSDQINLGVAMTIFWWEKTVEYYFIHRYVDIGALVAPLDGHHEKAGDAIFANTSSWILIEFKRDISTIRHELAKFSNFEKAKRELEPIGKHHLVIYGELDTNDIKLVSQEYFSETIVPVHKALASGVPKTKFIAYMKRLLRHKKNSKGGSGDFSLVAGVSNGGKITRCIKLSEFEAAIDFDKTLQNRLDKNQDQEPSDLSF